MNTKEFAEQVRAILAEELQGFWYEVREYNFLSDPCVNIAMAAKDFLINGVPDQRPQQVVLTYGYGELKSHYPVYREPDRSKPEEYYLAMKGVKVPFRKPKWGNVRVCGKAWVYGNARVWGKAWIGGDTKLSEGYHYETTKAQRLTMFLDKLQ